MARSEGWSRNAPCKRLCRNADGHRRFYHLPGGRNLHPDRPNRRWEILWGGYHCISPYGNPLHRACHHLPEYRNIGGNGRSRSPGTIHPMEREAEWQGCGIRRNSNGCRWLDLLCQPGGLSDHRQRSGYLYRPGIFPNQADPGCQPAAQCARGYSRRYRAAQQRQGAGGICSHGQRPGQG